MQRDNRYTDFVNQLVLDGWRTPDTYDSRKFSSFTQKPALYLFLRLETNRLLDTCGDFRILYVGQTTCLKKRMANHEILRKIPVFVQRWFLPCEAGLLRRQERRLIHYYNPPYNIIHRPRGAL